MSSEASTVRRPPGQRPGTGFPRFGAQPAGLPAVPDPLKLRITGEIDEPGEIDADALKSLPRHEQISDLHCVTTWTKEDLRWSGFRLADLYQQLIVPRFQPRPEAHYLVLFGLDGYCCSLLLEDALQEDVLVADTLDGEPLSLIHGAPLRVVSPQQYGYKSLKHLCGIGLRSRPVRLPLGLEHRRGRVALEERHALLPAWMVRLPFRALIGPTAWLHRRGLESGHFVGRPTLLDELMPECEHREVHDVWIDGSSEDVYRSLGEVTAGEIRLLAPLMALRGLPAWLAGRATPADRGIPIFDGLEQSGFAHLAEDPGREIVFGVVGRFWKLAHNQPVKSVRDRASFHDFQQPGYAKATMNLLVRAEGRGSRLITETRIQTTDPAAGRSFRRYWRLIRPGSGLIRRSWLAAVRRRFASTSRD